MTAAICGKSIARNWITVLHDSTADRFLGLAAGSPRNLWATHLSYSGTPANPVAVYKLLRITGSGWRVVRYPPGIIMATNATAVGDDNTWFIGRTSSGDRRLLHYRGAEWTSHPLEARTGIRDLQATEAGGVWVAGEADIPVDDPDDIGGTPFLRHFDGREWTSHALPDAANIVDIVRRTDDDVWAFGRSRNDANAVALQWDGDGWSDRSPRDALFEVHCGVVIDSANVWILGREHGANGLQPVSWRYNGSSWNESSAPVTSSGLLDAICDGDGGVWASGLWESTITRYTSDSWRRFKLWPSAPGRPDIQMFATALIPGTDKILIGARKEHSGAIGDDPTTAGVILTN